MWGPSFEPGTYQIRIVIASNSDDYVTFDIISNCFETRLDGGCVYGPISSVQCDDGVARFCVLQINIVLYLGFGLHVRFHYVNWI